MTAVEMTVRPSPPPPAECEHPAPTLGVMVHEFAPRAGALGPEGVRRTTTYYGPTMGGLPILAWHCEQCGLLRLTYPDGRKEERRLFTGPQPGLLAALVPEALTPEQQAGMQARVSGITVPDAYLAELLPPPAPPRQLPRIEVPKLGAITWITVTLLAVVTAGLLVGGVLAVAGYNTPSVEQPLFFVMLGCFLAAVATPIIGAVGSRVFPMPRLSPSPASALRGKPQIDPMTGLVVTLMSFTVIALLVGGVLAVYDYSTPGLEMPLFFFALGCFVAAVLVAIGGGVGRGRGRRSG